MSYVSLGEYTGYDQMQDAVTKEIVKRGGATDSSSMKAYGTAAGSAGGAAVCTAYGAAAAAPLCAKVGGAIVGLIAGHIGTAATAGAAWTLADDWNALRPKIIEAQRGVMSVRGYLTMRDKAIRDAANIIIAAKAMPQDVAVRYADQSLTALGVPGAPLRPEWAPRKDLWEAFKAFSIWAESPTGWPPHFGRTDYATMNYCTSSSLGPNKNVPFGHKSPTGNAVAGQVGITCQELLAMIFYPGGPMAAPGDPINWGMVGAWQMVSSFLPKQYMTLPLPPPDQLGGALYLFGAQTTEAFRKEYSRGKPFEVVSVAPSSVATELIFKLNEKMPELMSAAEAHAAKARQTAAATAQLKAAKLRLGTQASASAKYGAAALALGGAAVATYLVFRRR